LTLVYARFGTAGYPGAGHAAENGFAASELKNWFTSSKRGSLPPRSLGFDGRKPGDWGNECQRGNEVFPQAAQYGSGDGGDRGNPTGRKFNQC